MRFEISIMGIVFCKENVLLLQNEEGEWVFPKGQPQDIEDNITTVCREIKEESGVSVHPDDLIGYVGKFGYNYIKNNHDTRKTVFVYCFSIASQQEIKITEECYIRGSWLPIDEAQVLLTHTDSKKMFHVALHMSSNFDNLEKEIKLFLAQIENTTKFEYVSSLCNSQIKIISDSPKILNCAINECYQYKTVLGDDLLNIKEVKKPLWLYIISQPLFIAHISELKKYCYNKCAFFGKDYQKNYKTVTVRNLKISFAVEDGYVLIECENKKYLFLSDCNISYGVQIMRILREYIYIQKSNDGCTMLHAAGVRVNGHNLLILGNKGDGKTTLLCKLLASNKADYFVSNDKVWVSSCKKNICAYSYPAAVRIGHGTIESIDSLRSYINNNVLHRGINDKTEKVELTPHELTKIFCVDNVEQFVPEIIVITHFSKENISYFIENNYDKKEYIDEHILRFGSSETVNRLYALPLIHFYCKKECSPNEICNNLEDAIQIFL